MSKQSLSLLGALVIGIGVGCFGTYLIVSSQFQFLYQLSYLRHAVEARSDAFALAAIKNQQYAQATTMLEGRLSAALILLSDYENLVPLDRREPQVYSAVSAVRDYVRNHPETILPGPAESALDSLVPKDATRFSSKPTP